MWMGRVDHIPGEEAERGRNEGGERLRGEHGGGCSLVWGPLCGEWTDLRCEWTGGLPFCTPHPRCVRAPQALGPGALRPPVLGVLGVPSQAL